MKQSLHVHLREDDEALKADDWEQSSVYDTGRWLTVIRDGFGCKVARLDVMRGSECLARIPLATNRKFVFSLLKPLRGTHTEFGGMIKDTPEGADIIKAIHHFLKEKGFSWVEFVFPDPAQNIPLVMQDLGYAQDQKHSYLVDLSRSSDEIWDGFAGRARTEIRKAEKNGLTVERLTPAHNGSYMKLVEAVFAGQKRRPSFSLSFLDAVHHHMRPDEFSHYGVFDGGKACCRRPISAWCGTHGLRLRCVRSKQSEIGCQQPSSVACYQERTFCRHG